MTQGKSRGLSMQVHDHRRKNKIEETWREGKKEKKKEKEPNRTWNTFTVAHSLLSNLHRSVDLVKYDKRACSLFQTELKHLHISTQFKAFFCLFFLWNGGGGEAGRSKRKNQNEWRYKFWREKPTNLNSGAKTTEFKFWRGNWWIQILARTSPRVMIHESTLSARLYRTF